MTVRALDHQARSSAGRSRTLRSRAFSSIAIDEAAGDAEHRPEQPDRQRLDDDRGEDLAPRGAERAQHPELADPLGDGDREGVEDQEGADEDGDEAEDEQEDLQEAEVVADFFGAAVGVFLRRLDPDRRRGISLAIRCFSVVAETPSSAATEIWSKRPTLWVSALRHGQRHLGDAGAAEGGAAELGEADQPERLRALPWPISLICVAELQVRRSSAAALSIEASVGPRGRWPST